MSKILGALPLPDDNRKILSGSGEFVFQPVRKIFQFASDAATVDDDPQELHSFTLAGDVLFAAGQSLRAVYAGTFANNAHTKNVWFNWFGQSFSPITTTASGGAFRIEILAACANSHTLRLSAILSWTGFCSTLYGELTGLDFSEPHDLLLKAETPAAAGDLTLRMASCEWIVNI